MGLSAPNEAPIKAYNCVALIYMSAVIVINKLRLFQGPYFIAPFCLCLSGSGLFISLAQIKAVFQC